ncbi:hypothetical protein Dsin_008232 [Dipteronia sinensis]|uniref:Protein kinase domain-containing protein n=1 Tax=Dipteronia sinensis TaxID=43782 RepID=A0AAE0ANK0_9ROSI|nr:hypothetical protein Dsin_008232 [Dipteronia sinensis]
MMKKFPKTTKSSILKRRSYMKRLLQKLLSFSPNECKQFLGQKSFGSIYFLRRKSSKIDGFSVEMAIKTAKVSEASTLKSKKQLLFNLTTSPYVIRCYGDEETEEDFDEYSGNVNNG